jgi:hypothetical protein
VRDSWLPHFAQHQFRVYKTPLALIDVLYALTNMKKTLAISVGYN